jgi:prevent-host-death family protein
MNVRELRADLAATLRRAEAGEQIVVTVGGRAVAQVGPLTPHTAGPVVPARRGDRPPPAVVIPLPVGTRLDRLLGEVRG